MWSEIRHELLDWTTSRERTVPPDNLVIITNVALTAAPSSGGRDAPGGTARDFEKFS